MNNEHRLTDCPICGHEISIPRHEHGTPYTQKQSFIMLRLSNVGIPYKVIARLLGTKDRAVCNHLVALRHGRIVNSERLNIGGKT